MQGLLPYKTFDWFDVLGNLLGASVGLYLAERLERYARDREELAQLYLPLDEEELYGLSEAEQAAEASPQARRDRDSTRARKDQPFALEDSDEDDEDYERD